MKKSLLFLSSLLLFFCLLIFPARTFFYACEGVNLWFHTILPSLLPFLILTSLLLETGAARRISARAEVFFQTVFGLSPAGFYALFLGLFCGFPMGARITAQLYEAEEIDRNEACYLLTFCSSPSPAFLSSYVILTAFSGQIHPGFVFGVLYGSNFLTGFLFRLVFRRFRLHRHTAHRTHSMEKKEMSKQTSKGNLLDTSIMNGFEIITQLGGHHPVFHSVRTSDGSASVWFRLAPALRRAGNHDGNRTACRVLSSLRRKSLCCPYLRRLRRSLCRCPDKLYDP